MHKCRMALQLEIGRRRRRQRRVVCEESVFSGSLRQNFSFFVYHREFSSPSIVVAGWKSQSCSLNFFLSPGAKLSK